MDRLGEAFNFGDPDVRSAWAVIGPFALVGSYIVFALAARTSAKRVLGAFERTFKPFLTLEEAEELVSGSSKSQYRQTFPSPWITSTLSWTATLEACAWMTSAMYILAGRGENDGNGVAREACLAGCMVMTWVYAAVKPVVKRKVTPNYDLFILYIILLAGGILTFGGVLYDRAVNSVSSSVISLVLQSFNLVAIFSLIIIELSRPIAIPRDSVDIDQIGKTLSPEDYTTLWKWLSFSWIHPLIKKGTHATLNETDVWELTPIVSIRPVFVKFTKFRRRSLFHWLVVSNALDISLDISLTILSVMLSFTGPYFLMQILDAIDSPDRARHVQAYVYACLAFIARLLKAQADLHRLYFSRRAAIRVQEALMAAIYNKALKRKDLSGAANLKNEKSAQKGGEARSGADLGKILNLMSADTNRIVIMAQAINLLYSGVSELIIGSVFLFQLLGWAALAGFAVLIISWPINSFLTKSLVAFQRRLSTVRDKRMAVLNELITSLKFLKFFAWEDHWIDRVLQSRAVELAMLVKVRSLTVLLKIITAAAPILVSVFAFFTFVVQGHELTVGIAFTSIALFGMIRTPLNLVPEIIAQVMQSRVNYERVGDFLFEEEVNGQVSSLKDGHRDSTHRIGLKNARLTWNSALINKTKKDSNKKSGSSNGTAPHEVSKARILSDSDSEGERRFELKDVSLSFPEDRLTLITGPTASGKTALLLALLGEMTLLDGEILLSKDTTATDEHGNTQSISYAAQTPWLQHKSIKDNVLFGHAYDEARYDLVLECCALKPDLEVFEDGDLTEIGARGVSLSGGQKARVALARAVYAPTKYVLLDDPLSAVDSHTARFLLERLFFGPLLEHRTVVLVTHHVDLVLPATYYIVKLMDGRVEHQGAIEELRVNGVLEAVSSGSKTKAESEQGEIYEVEKIESDGVEKSLDGSKSLKNKVARKLITEEGRATGGVKWSVYNSYLNASSYWTWGILFLLSGVAQLLTVGEKWWIMKWGEAYGNPSESSFATLFPFWKPRYQSLPSAQERPMFYVEVYASIGALNILVAVSSTIVLILGGLRAARLLFKRLLVGVAHATMRWHDTTPAGRLLNRFGRDIEIVDMNLADDLQSVNISLSTFLAPIIVVAVVFPAFLLPAFVIGYIYYILAVGYLNAGRDLRRMESNARSPIYSDFSDILEGIVTVRAFSAERRFLEGFFKKVDLMQKMYYCFWMMNRHLFLRYDALGALAVLITTLLALSGYVTAGLAGLCITSAMAFSENIYWTCRFWTQLELDLNSVERVIEYLDLPQEPPSILRESRPPAHWPSYSGTDDNNLVVIEDLEIRYSPESPVVLHGISLTLKAGERVGLLGRTGSGKSTLAMSILRFVDPSRGRIIIDGIDIATIGLHDLRSRLTFIPQDATLFSGTLRENLDPFGEHSDVERLDALRRVHLISENSSPTEDQSSVLTPEGDGSLPSANGEAIRITLDTEVSAGGLNFSAGQRQLITLARALLRHSAVIIFDEATSSIDFDTDVKIQTAIREEFTGSLLLTIAHRLNTIIDYDRLVILDSGKLAEMGTPAELIEREGSIFREMCQKSGKFDEFADRIRKGQR